MWERLASETVWKAFDILDTTTLLILEALAIITLTHVKRSTVEWKDLKWYLKSEKRHLERQSTSFYLQDSQRIDWKQKENLHGNSLDYRPLQKTLKYRKRKWFFSTNWKTRLQNIHKNSANIYESSPLLDLQNNQRTNIRLICLHVIKRTFHLVMCFGMYKDIMQFQIIYCS